MSSDRGISGVLLSARKPPARVIAWALALAAVQTGLTAPLQAAPCDAAILLTPHAPYRQAAQTIESRLDKSGYRCSVIQIAQPKPEHAPKDGKPDPEKIQAAGSEESEDEQISPEEATRRLVDLDPKVVVSVGTAATSLVLRVSPEKPVVFCMVPNALDHQFGQPSTRPAAPLTGVTTDVAPDTQLAWIGRLSPSVKTLGVLHSKRTRKTVQAIQRAAHERNIAVEAIQASADKFPAAVESIQHEDCDAVLMIADSEVYNSASVRRLLLWGLRERKAVWTFSENLVEAGAFAGLYASTTSMAEQTAEVADRWLRGEHPDLPVIQYPQEVFAAANKRTAEMIGISISPEDLEQLAICYGE